MDFKTAYESYKAGTATDEEKEYVESELAKAREFAKVIDEVDSKRAIAPSDLDDVKRAKAKHTKLTILRTTLVVFLCIIVIGGAVCGGIFGSAISAAKANDKVGYDEAQAIASDFVVRNYAITDGIVTEVERELKLSTKLKHSYYNYYVEIESASGRELEIVVDSKTGIAKLDILDD